MKKTSENTAAEEIANAPIEILATRSPEHGFWGTTKLNGRFKVAKEWAEAFAWVAKAMPGWNAERIRDFLEGCPGRHLADEATYVGGVAKVDSRRWREEFLLLAAEVDEKAVPATEVKAIFKAIRKSNDLLAKLNGYRRGLRNYRAELATVDSPEAQAICRAIDEQLIRINEGA